MSANVFTHARECFFLALDEVLEEGVALYMARIFLQALGVPDYVYQHDDGKAPPWPSWADADTLFRALVLDEEWSVDEAREAYMHAVSIVQRTGFTPRSLDRCTCLPDEEPLETCPIHGELSERDGAP